MNDVSMTHYKRQGRLTPLCQKTLQPPAASLPICSSWDGKKLPSCNSELYSSNLRVCRYKTLKAALIAFVIATLVVVLAGCGKTGSPESMPTQGGEGRQTSESLAGWWEAKWSENGANLNVRYTRSSGTLSETTHVEGSYNPFGTQTGGRETKQRKGEDIYGRQQDTTIQTPSSWRGSSVKPDSTIASGTFSYPAGVPFEQSAFGRSLKATIHPEYNEAGQLTGGSGSEEFSGHLSSSAGKILYSGNVVANFTVQNGELAWTERTEKTSYSYDGKPYAETVAVVTPESKYLGGRFVVVRETLKTTTSYSDGSRRESEIVILWQRNESGVATGKSGSGTVIGNEVIKGKPVNYTGSIGIDYGFDSRIGWYKVGYSEKRSAKTALPTHLPFEVVFVDDPYLSVFDQ